MKSVNVLQFQQTIKAIKAIGGGDGFSNTAREDAINIHSQLGSEGRYDSVLAHLICNIDALMPLICLPFREASKQRKIGDLFVLINFTQKLFSDNLLVKDKTNYAYGQLGVNQAYSSNNCG